MPLISRVDLPQLYEVLRYKQYCSCPAQLFLGRRGSRRKQAGLTNGSTGGSPPCMLLACYMPEGNPWCSLVFLRVSRPCTFWSLSWSIRSLPSGWDVSASQSWQL